MVPEQKILFVGDSGERKQNLGSHYAEHVVASAQPSLDKLDSEQSRGAGAGQEPYLPEQDNAKAQTLDSKGNGKRHALVTLK